MKHHPMGPHATKRLRGHYKKGGVVHEGDIAHDETPDEVYAGARSHVVREASAKKRGGSVHHGKHHMKHVEMHGEHAKHRLDRPARKAGGRVGSEMNPLSAASRVKTPAGRDVDPEYD
jgi:hypothetical protein